MIVCEPQIWNTQCVLDDVWDKQGACKNSDHSVYQPAMAGQILLVPNIIQDNYPEYILWRTAQLYFSLLNIIASSFLLSKKNSSTVSWRSADTAPIMTRIPEINTNMHWLPKFGQNNNNQSIPSYCILNMNYDYVMSVNFNWHPTK